MEAIEKYKIIEESFVNHLGFLVANLSYDINIEKDDFSQPITKQLIRIQLKNQLLDRNIYFMYQPFNGNEYTVFMIEKFFSSTYIYI